MDATSIVSSPLKRCTKCSLELPATLEYFSARKRSKDGQRAQCKACIAEYNREYAAAHHQRRAEYRAAWHRRRARKLSATGTHTPADILTLRAGQTDKRGILHCWWCACTIEGDAFHVDHRIPLAKGGTNDAGNLCLSCASCNLRKGAKLSTEWNGRLL